MESGERGMRTEQLAPEDRCRVYEARVTTSSVSTQGERRFHITDCMTREGMSQAFDVSVEIDRLADVFELVDVCRERVVLDEARRFPSHLLMNAVTIIPCRVISAAT